MKSLKTLGAVALLSTSMLGAATSFAATPTDKGGIEPSPAEEQTPVKAKFKLPDNGGTNPDPENPDQSGKDPDKNKPLNPTGPFGIAYVPVAFQTENYDSDGVALKEEGQQDVAFTNTDARVGVKDKTRTAGGWTLSATLSWNEGKAVPGSTITFSKGQGIKINTGKGYTDAGSNLTEGDMVINNQATPLMMASTLDGDNFYDATYDLDMSNPTLHIEDASKVKAGDYAGNVTWKLTAATV